MDYISSADQETLSARYQKTKLVVAALGLSVLIYLMLGRLITLSPPSVEAGWEKTFYFAALAMGLAVVALRRLLLSRLLLSPVVKRGVGAALGSLGTASILCAALGEAVGILGLVAYLVTGNAEYSWRLGVIGLLLIVYSFPRRGEWERVVSAAAKNSAQC